MKTLQMNSFEFQSTDEDIRIMISWSKDKFPNLEIIKDQLNILEVQAYELSEEQLEFVKKYHIPFKRTYYSLDEINNISNLIEEYQELIEVAEVLNLKWDYSTFNYEGLKEAVEHRLTDKKKS